MRPTAQNIKKMKEVKITREPIYKNGCWDCKRALEDQQEKYICPKLEQHWQEYNEKLINLWY